MDDWENAKFEHDNNLDESERARFEHEGDLDESEHAEFGHEMGLAVQFAANLTDLLSNHNEGRYLDEDIGFVGQLASVNCD